MEPITSPASSLSPRRRANALPRLFDLGDGRPASFSLRERRRARKFRNLMGPRASAGDGARPAFSSRRPAKWRRAADVADVGLLPRQFAAGTRRGGPGAPITRPGGCRGSGWHRRAGIQAAGEWARSWQRDGIVPFGWNFGVFAEWKADGFVWGLFNGA